MPRAEGNAQPRCCGFDDEEVVVVEANFEHCPVALDDICEVVLPNLGFRQTGIACHGSFMLLRLRYALAK